MAKQSPTRIDTTNWSRENLAWLAGRLETAYIGLAIRRKKYGILHIRHASGNMEVLKRELAIAGCGWICVNNNKCTKNPSYFWNVTRIEHVYALAVALCQFLCKSKQEEIKKLILHFASIPSRLTSRYSHGSYSRYSNDGCRCSECRATVRLYQRQHYHQREYRRTHKYQEVTTA